MKLPILYQRIEAVFIFLASACIYGYLGFSFLWFILLLFTIDIFMFGYLVNNKIGAHVYNAGHSLIVPAALCCIGIITDNQMMIGLGLIWLAHIGLDRAFGYGLKLPGGFGHTHLGNIGKGN